MILESIERLRKYGHDCCARVDDAIHDYADAIEREIAERYQILPLDAGGVPIRVGDVLKLPNGEITAVRFITFNDAGWLVNESGWLPDKVTHQQPDTWERIIEDAMKLGYTDPDNERLEKRLLIRCKTLAGED